MVDISSLADLAGKLNSVSGIVLVNPNKNIGISPNAPSDQENYVFHYEGENTVTLDSDITDHFVEDNTAIQDQIALKPEIMTLTGYIGELNDVVPGLLSPLKLVADKLTAISAYTPVLSARALIAFNQASQAYAQAALVANAIKGALSVLPGVSPVQNEQQKAYVKFKNYWKNRQLFSVQSPWEVHQNMVIKTIRAVQDEETRVISSFEITFKKMQFAQSITTLSSTLLQGRASDQASDVIDHGPSTGTVGPALSPLMASTGSIA